MSESSDTDDDTSYSLPEVDAIAGHRSMAYAELRRQGCSHSVLGYNSDYDSYFCIRCNIWAEPTCNDRRCVYCARRPTVPSLAHRH